MTNAQKWIAAFLVLFLVLFALSRLTKEEDEYIDEPGYSETFESNEQIDGLTLINRVGCTSCHGVDLKGSNLAPGLYSAKEYWSRDKLINYLRNPSSYSGDERFEAYKEKYKSIMPSFSNIDVKQLGVIADYLLSLEEQK